MSMALVRCCKGISQIFQVEVHHGVSESVFGDVVDSGREARLGLKALRSPPARRRDLDRDCASDP